MFYTQEDLSNQLKILEEKQILSSSEKTLRSKIDSILRTLENLSQKKLRIDLEIKRQKRSLARKRLELKKNSKHVQAKIKLALESEAIEVSDDDPHGSQLDNYLLRESARALDE